MNADNPYRLPRTVTPERYELVLTPQLDSATFTGVADIAVRVREAVTEIKLNAAELDIALARLVDSAGAELAGVVSLDEESEVATISLAGAAEAGAWTLHLEFAGTLNDKLRGFYRSTYADAQGNQHTIATTQFEATDARRAFPCWDEPDFKAVFAVTLIVADELTALSNASVKSETGLGDGGRRVEFEDTMVMSTYLVAFIVGRFAVSDPVDVDGVPLRVVCIPGREPLVPFALEAGEAALRYLTSYFGIPYPGGKLDLVAIPDFAFGAMENLGCVTFRETALLVDPKRASRLEIERVADVIGHEIAHMWFGDLVTMKWWNGIWLNEAFATFMQLSFTNDFRPNWDRWISFGLAKSAAMTIDSLSSTRPIEFEVVDPAEAQGMFDLLTYQKGAAVLRMLEQHLGPQQFAAGISAYLAEHAYGNAETADLWDALEDTTSQPVRVMMDSWILQGGHPVVRAELTDDGQSLRLSQRRFRYLPDEDSTAMWHVPVGLRFRSGGAVSSQQVALSDSSATVELPAGFENVVVNDGAHGFFRVSYSADLLARITSDLTALQPLERFALATDTWALCLAGVTPLQDVLNVVRSLACDSDPDVLGAALAPLRMLDRIIDDTDRPKLAALVNELLAPQYQSLGWIARDGESERTATLRGVVISALGGLGQDADVQRAAASRYQDYLTGSGGLDANLVQPTQAVLASTDDPAHYDTLYATFADAGSTPQERVNALNALARFTRPELVNRTLALITDNEVRTQDAPYAIQLMLSQRDSGTAVWQWCEQNWDDLMQRFPDNSIARMVEGVTAQVSPEFAARVEAFLTEHPVRQAQKAIAQICERLRVNAAFYQRTSLGAGQLL